MKVFGIYIFTDRTLRILFEFARNTAFNEVAYQKLMDEKQLTPTVIVTPHHQAQKGNGKDFPAKARNDAAMRIFGDFAKVNIFGGDNW